MTSTTPGNALLIIPIITALITVGLGGIVAAIVTFYMNRSHNEMVFIRSKVESLYLASEEYGRRFLSSSFAYQGVVNGTLDWNQCNDIILETSAKEMKAGGHETVRMLVAIYFPSIRPHLERLVEVRKAHAAAVHQLRKDYDRGLITSRTKILFETASLKFNDANDELNDAIRNLATNSTATQRLAAAWRKKPKRIKRS